MAKGLAYYNVDTDRFQDIKIKRLRKALGATGYAVYEYILNEIYRVGGGVLEWDESRALDVSDYWAVTENLVNEVVTTCLAMGLFDKAVYQCGCVLTSHSIQSRYAQICKKTHRQLDIPDAYNLLGATDAKPSNAPKEVTQKAELSRQTPQMSIQSDDLSIQNPAINKRKENIPLLFPASGENTKPAKRSFDLEKAEWLTVEMRPVLQKWLDYKRSRGQTYKTEASARTCYNHLCELSAGKPDLASAIVDQSIACNYAGLFALKGGGVAGAPQNNFVAQTEGVTYEKF